MERSILWNRIVQSRCRTLATISDRIGACNSSSVTLVGCLMLSVKAMLDYAHGHFDERAKAERFAEQSKKIQRSRLLRRSTSVASRPMPANYSRTARREAEFFDTNLHHNPRPVEHLMPRVSTLGARSQGSYPTSSAATQTIMPSSQHPL